MSVSPLQSLLFLEKFLENIKNKNPGFHRYTEHDCFRLFLSTLLSELMLHKVISVCIYLIAVGFLLQIKNILIVSIDLSVHASLKIC